MIAYIAQSPGKAEFCDIPTPTPKKDEILIKVKRAGICGTDLAIYSGDCSFVRSGEIVYPVRFGHEWSGVVDAVGEEVTDFKPGDRVFAENGVACGECDFCKKGDYNNCKDIRSVGTIKCYDGCFAEYMLMPRRHVFHLPDNISFDTGALLEPFGIALQGFNHVELNEDSFVVVIGTGAIGISALCLAKHFGAKTAIVGRKDSKLEVAKELGADYLINTGRQDMVQTVLELTGGYGANLVIETSGAEEMLCAAVGMVAPYATISVLGFYEKNLNGLPIDHLVFNDITIRGGAGKFYAAETVCKILSNSDLPVEKMITHRVKFSDCAEHFENASKYSKDRIKTMIEFD